MTIEQMKDFLVHGYPGSEWAKKVATMPDDQIIAIYKRMQEQNLPRKNHAKSIQVRWTIYECRDCGKTFRADGDELDECRFCGGHKLIRKNHTEYIRKG